MLDVINIVDGKRLGNITDLDIDADTGDIKSLIISSGGGWFSFFGRRTDVEIPWNHIKKIGIDVILVELADIAEKYRKELNGRSVS